MPKYIDTPHSADGLGRLRPGYHWNYALDPMTGTDDLMRSPEPRAREVGNVAWRTEGPKSNVRHGYVYGSKAHGAAQAMGLSPVTNARRPFGTVEYVQGPKPVAKAKTERTRAEALGQKLDKQATEAERLRAFAAQFTVVGQMDWLASE